MIGDEKSTTSRPADPHEWPTFSDAALLQWLDGHEIRDTDLLDFGVITIRSDDRVIGYNRYESGRAGIRAERVLGRDLFVDVAPCLNNFMVAERYRTDGDLDEELDYVFTFRMRPTPVRLRLLAAAGGHRRYLAIRPR